MIIPLQMSSIMLITLATVCMSCIGQVVKLWVVVANTIFVDLMENLFLKLQNFD